MSNTVILYLNRVGIALILVPATYYVFAVMILFVKVDFFQIELVLKSKEILPFVLFSLIIGIFLLIFCFVVRFKRATEEEQIVRVNRLKWTTIGILCCVGLIKFLDYHLIFLSRSERDA